MYVNPQRDTKEAAEDLIKLAFVEDFGAVGDITSNAMIPESATATVQIVAREDGILAGLSVAEQVFATLDDSVTFQAQQQDGSAFSKGDVIAEISGPLRSLLKGERIALNFLTHLSGVATLTRQFVDAVEGTKAKILDTRKTLPGWRLLQKYAVAAGGGMNHRLGLYDGCLIKDNHLAAWRTEHGAGSVAKAIQHARNNMTEDVPIEVEVDTLEQLTDALQAAPDIVLLDNMATDMLCEAVALRNRQSKQTLLEASGGITLETVADIARTGVERISIGAITHSAIAVDLAFDWKQ